METPTPQEAPEIMADTVSFWIFLVTLFLVPIFFIPSKYAPLSLDKSLIILLPLIVGIMVWVLGRLKEGKIEYPKARIFSFFLIIPILFGISNLFSGSRMVSLVGHDFEIGTLTYVVAMFFLAYFVYQLFNTTRKAAYSYLAFFASFVIIALFQLIRIFFGPSILSFGIFTTSTSAIVGSWNDLGIFFGAGALFSFISLELLRLDGKIRALFIALLAISLFFLSIINFSTVWYMIALFSLIFFIYNFSLNKGSRQSDAPSSRKLPLVSLVVFILAIVFILIRGNLYDILANDPFDVGFVRKFDISNVEVRPSIISTFDVVKDTMWHHPIFGTGPNRFVAEWLVSKPVEINSSNFWNTDFNYGYGLIPTFLVTTGILSFLAWLAFIGFLIVLGFKAIFSKRTDPLSDYIRISSFVISLYLWIFMILYVPSATIIFLTFFFTGVFLGSLSGTSLLPTSSFSFIRDPKISFVSVLVFVGVLLVALVFGYNVILRSVSSFYYDKGLAVASSGGNLTDASNYLNRAVQFSTDDIYYQALSSLYLSDINSLVANQSQLSKDAIQKQFRTDISNAQATALAAKNFDSTNYQNYITLGRVSESVIPLNVDGAYDGAHASYLSAQKLDPLDPSIPLMLARLEIERNNPTQAKVYITQALSLKNDYTDAILTLSQIQVNQGDIASAIQSLQQATLVSPNDAGLYFQLGLLRYDNKDYKGAGSAFEQSINLIPSYANAQYFLGLSLAKLGDTADAIKEFQAVLVTNTDNQQVKTIISNLQAGRDAMYGIQPPNNAPEKAPTPPVSDSSTTSTASTKGTTTDKTTAQK